MNRLTALTQREVMAYLFSPIAYLTRWRLQLGAQMRFAFAEMTRLILQIGAPVLAVILSGARDDSA